MLVTIDIVVVWVVVVVGIAVDVVVGGCCFDVVVAVVVGGCCFDAVVAVDVACDVVAVAVDVVLLI